MLDVLENVVLIQQDLIFDLKGKNYDFLIEPNLQEMGLRDFKKYEYGINAGRAATELIIEDIVNLKNKLQNKLNLKNEIKKSKIIE